MCCIKTFNYIVALFCICYGCGSKKNDHGLPDVNGQIGSGAERTRKSDSIKGIIHREFAKHFHILDSATKISKKEEIWCCGESAWFMMIQTNIDSEGELNYVGVESFTKNDVKKWHEWYGKNKEMISILKPLY